MEGWKVALIRMTHKEITVKSMLLLLKGKTHSRLSRRTLIEEGLSIKLCNLNLKTQECSLRRRSSAVLLQNVSYKIFNTHSASSWKEFLILVRL
jgi:hypothetical protein